MIHFRNELVRCPYISLVEQSYSQATLQHFSPIPRLLSSFSVLFPGHSPAFSCTAKAEKDPGNEATVKYVG